MPYSTSFDYRQLGLSPHARKTEEVEVNLVQNPESAVGRLNFGRTIKSKCYVAVIFEKYMSDGELLGYRGTFINLPRFHADNTHPLLSICLFREAPPGSWD